MILVENVYLNRDGSRLRNSSASHYHDVPSTLFNDSAISDSGSSSREADLKNIFVSRKLTVGIACVPDFGEVIFDASFTLLYNCFRLSYTNCMSGIR